MEKDLIVLSVNWLWRGYNLSIGRSHCDRRLHRSGSGKRVVVKALAFSKGIEMAALILTSPRQRSLRSLVEAALQNELRLVQAGIQRTERRLQAFETQYGLSSTEFLRRYENDELPETLDFAEWVGEYRLRERLREKTAILQEIRVAD
ncbi:MAG: hypothetical protein ACE5JL_06765 [Dehalococcoidia bacterium]